MNKKFEEIAAKFENKKMADVVIDNIQNLIDSAEEIFSEEPDYLIALGIAGHFTYFACDKSPHFYCVSVKYCGNVDSEIVIRSDSKADYIIKQISDFVADCDVAMADVDA